MSTERYVDGQYAQDHAEWHDEDAEWKASSIAQFLREEALRPKSLCDIGCGTGGILASLARSMPGVELVGYDISPQAVTLARQKHPQVDIRLGGVTDITERYDVITLIDVFEHVEDYLGFLRALAPFCNHLLCHVPLEMTSLMVAREKTLLWTRREFGHLHYFSRATVLATLEDAGYVIRASRYTPVAVDFPRLTIRMTLAKWPRKLLFRVASDFTARVLGGYSLLTLADVETS